jgi:peroxiredoxin
VSTALLLVRLVLAGVLGVAGLAKLADRAGSRQAVADFGVPGRLASPGAFLLPLVELLAAALLLPATTAGWGGLLALLLLAFFVAAIGVNLAKGRKPDCHCFGQLHSAPAGWSTLVRNLVLAGGAAFVVVAGWDDGGASVTGWLGDLEAVEVVGLVAGLVLLGLVLVEGWAILNLLRQHGRLLLRIEALEGRDGVAGSGTIAVGGGASQGGLPVGTTAPGFELPTVAGDARSLDDLLRASKPVLLVFTDPGCGPCSALLPEVAHWQREHAARVTVALVASGTVDANRAKAAEHGLADVLVERAGTEVSSSYRYPGTPSAVLVDTAGRIGSPVAAGAEAIRSLFRQHVGPGAAGHVGPAAVPLVPRPGQVAPSFELPDLAGTTRRLEDFRGRETLLVFWNPSCGFCQRLLPDWKEWESAAPADGRPQPVVVSTGPVADNQALGLRSPVLLDANFEVGPRFGATGTPMAVLIDHEGRIASEVAAGASAVLALANRAEELAASVDAAPDNGSAKGAKA